jgi:hypothetical protein
MATQAIIQVKRGTEAIWSQLDPVLQYGELGLDSSNNIIKVGDGERSWGSIAPFISNPMRELPSGTQVLSRVCVASPLTDFNVSGNVEMLAPPDGYLLMIDAMEVVVTVSSGSGELPVINFGNTEDPGAYKREFQLVDGAAGARNILAEPQNCISSGTMVTFGVVTPSNQSELKGFGLVTGSLLKATLSGGAVYAMPKSWKNKTLISWE